MVPVAGSEWCVVGNCQRGNGSLWLGVFEQNIIIHQSSVEHWIHYDLLVFPFHNWMVHVESIECLKPAIRFRCSPQATSAASAFSSFDSLRIKVLLRMYRLER